MDLSKYAASAGASAPSAPASPSAGYPSDGNPSSGAPATIPGAYWFYQLQAEITHLLTTAGITPAAGTLTQLASAVAALASGVSYEGVIENIKVNGTAALGVRNTCARGDHVHPTDTTRAPVASPTFTGVPAAPTAAAGTNTTQLATTAFVAAALAGIGSGSTVPAGTVIAFAGPNAPDGYILCNGASWSRSGYPALWAAIGTTYGAGNGSTTFNVPDYRGVFLRGLDLGIGRDPGRALGSLQKGTLQMWDSGATVGVRCLQTNTVTGSATQALVGADPYSLSADYSGMRTAVTATGVEARSYTDNNQLGSAEYYSGVTRPVNRSVYFYIKY